MDINKINSYADFCTEIQKIGFSIGGGNAEGIFTIAQYYTNRIKDHTGDIDTDPWEWRIKGITECDNLAYGKLFFGKSGWITKEWYPYFLSVRRKGRTFEEEYYDGMLPVLAKDVYRLIVENPNISLYEIKTMLELGKERKSAFDKAITELQMKMYITISGQKQKISNEGKPYGWPVTTFCTIEEFWGNSILEDSKDIDPLLASDLITKRILELNENAKMSKINKFMK